MECLEFVYGTLDGCLCFRMGKSIHKPIFDEFGSKRTLLGIFVTPRNLYRYKLRKIIMTGICIGIN